MESTELDCVQKLSGHAAQSSFRSKVGHLTVERIPQLRIGFVLEPFERRSLPAVGL